MFVAEVALDMFVAEDMDRWSNRGGQRQRRERVGRKKINAREKVEKSLDIVFFQCFVAPQGREVGSLKLRVRSHLGRCEMKNCAPLWREANLKVKMMKTAQVRNTFGSWDAQKVHAVAARRRVWSQNVKNTMFGLQRCTLLWREAHFQVNMVKHQMFTPLLDVQASFSVACAMKSSPCQ